MAKSFLKMMLERTYICENCGKESRLGIIGDKLICKYCKSKKLKPKNRPL